MGIDNRRPPLPAPTESMDENSGVETEVATNVTTRTDKTSYSIPEDGSPITISTQKYGDAKRSPGTHRRQKSQTSLLIEYFETGRDGDKSRSKPSVRVKVTPSAGKKGKLGSHDAVQITGIGHDRKPSYSRRISLSGKHLDTTLHPIEGTELSASSSSTRGPLEIEVLHPNESDISNSRSSRGLRYAPEESNVSSMPADSLVEGIRNVGTHRDMNDETSATVVKDHLAAPLQRTRSRSTSQDRITQKVMEKLGQPDGKSSKAHRSSRERVVNIDGKDTSRRRRTSKSRQGDEDALSRPGSGLASPHLSPSHRSYHSNSSQASKMTNNPKLLEMVEDTIKRMILPEISAIKQKQTSEQHIRLMERSRRRSASQDSYDEGEVENRLDRSARTTKSTKPKVVLNRDDNDPGTTLSRGDSEYRKVRKSSRDGETRSSSRRSGHMRSRQGDGYDESELEHDRSIKSDHALGDLAAGGLAGGILTAAALKHHDSSNEIHERRKMRSKTNHSRSRSASLAETHEPRVQTENIPPMPLASKIADSDVTRDSLVSSMADQPASASYGETERSVHDRSHRHIHNQSPLSEHTLGMSNGRKSVDSPRGNRSTKDRVAALAAVSGLGGAAYANASRVRHVDTDGYGEPGSPNRYGSPVQSVSSLKKHFEDDVLLPQAARPRSAASRSSAGLPVSSRSSPTTAKLDDSRNHSRHQIDHDADVLFVPNVPLLRENSPGTPVGETVDEWYDRQHRVNDDYRKSWDKTTSNRDSYQTNPFADDERTYPAVVAGVIGGGKDIRPVGAVPGYVHASFGAESNVASLMDPSMLSSSVQSSQDSPSKVNGTYADRAAHHIRGVNQDPSPMYNGSTLSEHVPSHDRWAAIRGHARQLSTPGSANPSPRQREAHDLREHRSLEPVMGQSGLPIVDDPLPEIGHYEDSKSDIITNPSIIHGPLGGDATGNDTWPYTPNAEHHFETARARKLSQPSLDDRSDDEGIPRNEDARVDAAAFDEALDDHSPESRLSKEELVEEDYPEEGPARSVGAITPVAEQKYYSKRDVDDYKRAMDAQDAGDDDPFIVPGVHVRKISGTSHGLESPLYDSATGNGVDRIQSKDVVALMDHLTVRDAQRNARDTEILVTLVRSAAEMRQSFEEMKRFIAEQDHLIMQNASRDQMQLSQSLGNGSRPLPSAAIRAVKTSQDEVQGRRKNVLQRALKSLTGGNKRADDLARVERMLMHILDNVEDLKQGTHTTGVVAPEAAPRTLSSYEKLRSGPDPTYGHNERAGSSSTPSRSDSPSLTPKAEKQQFHSGYDGRRGSNTRVSTVAEDDEDDLEPHETHVLNHQFENNERMLTPTQELVRQRQPAYREGPANPSAKFGVATIAANEDMAPRSAEKQRKHKSSNSSIFAVPKISRWSKTTASSAVPEHSYLDSPNHARLARPVSEKSRSGSEIDQFDDDDDYELQEDDRLRSTQSLAREQARPISQAEARSVRSQASALTRTPSPLIPSEASRPQDDHEEDRDFTPDPEAMEMDDYDFDDAKYHAHRNSLLLQHPQPRQGSTSRHQNTLETQAVDFDDPTTNSDLSQRTVSDFDPANWGSAGTAALARNRVPQAEPLSPVSMSSPAAYTGRRKDDGPLIPQQSKPVTARKMAEPEPEPELEDTDWEPQYSNSGFSRGGYYSSPYGSGHLLEPIEEVRYSLETDRTTSPEATAMVAQAAEIRSPARKITGPRPMTTGAYNRNAQSRGMETSGTVRRKPKAQSEVSDEDSLSRDEIF